MLAGKVAVVAGFGDVGKGVSVLRSHLNSNTNRNCPLSVLNPSVHTVLAFSSRRLTRSMLYKLQWPVMKSRRWKKLHPGQTSSSRLQAAETSFKASTSPSCPKMPLCPSEPFLWSGVQPIVHDA